MAKEYNLNLEDFDSLPDQIKDWLSSAPVSYFIMDINRRLGFKDNRLAVIPKLIFMLVTKIIKPDEFINELSHELNVSFENAKTITEEIEKNILRPIEISLRSDTDIDIKLFYFGKPGPQNSVGTLERADSIEEITPKEETAKLPEKPAVPTVDLQSFRIKSEQPSRPLSPLNFPSTAATAGQAGSGRVAPALTPLEAAGVRSAPLPLTEPASPFILHQETPTIAPTLNPKPSTLNPQAASLPKTNLTMKVQNFYQSSSVPEKPIQKPVSVRIETPVPDSTAQKTAQPIQITKQNTPPAPKPELPPTPPTASNSNEIRVVHYSDLRTPINSLGIAKNQITKDNILDLRKFM